MYAKNAWKKYEGKKMDELMNFCQNYIDFLSSAKTERLCVEKALELAKQRGFKNINEVE